MYQVADDIPSGAAVKMSEESENSQNPSSQVQIDDVLQGNFEVNTQGQYFTTNPGGSALNIP